MQPECKKGRKAAHACSVSVGKYLEAKSKAWRRHLLDADIFLEKYR